MKRFVLVILLVPLALCAWSRNLHAEAGVVNIEAGAGASACNHAARVQSGVEAYLQRPLAEVDGSVRVRLERKKQEWRAKVELLDASGNPLGERTLIVAAKDCGAIEQYLALALALQINPHALDAASPMQTQSEPAEAEPEDGEAISSEAPPALEATPDESEPSQPPVSDDLMPGRFGNGSTLVLLMPSMGAESSLRGKAERLSPAWIARSLGRALGEFAMARETLSLVPSSHRFERERDLQRWLRDKTARRSAPVVDVPGGGKRKARFGFAPTLSRLTIREGWDYSTGDKARAWTCSVRFELGLVDFSRHRELPSIQLERTMAYAGSGDLERDLPVIVQLAFANLARDAFDELRVYPEFRESPRIVSRDGGRGEFALPILQGIKAGHGLVFVDEQGNASGYATAYDVDGGQGRFVVHREGEGERLREDHAFNGGRIAVFVDYARRAAYRDASAEELAESAADGRPTSKLGARGEIGFRGRWLGESPQPRSVTWLVDVRTGYHRGDEIGYVVGADFGAGARLSLSRTLGLAMTPNLRLGGVVASGGMQVMGDPPSQVDWILGAGASVGAMFEAYRVFGGYSLLVDVSLQGVLPLASERPASEFLNDKLPALHGVFLGIGSVDRGSDYAQ